MDEEATIIMVLGVTFCFITLLCCCFISPLRGRNNPGTGRNYNHREWQQPSNDVEWRSTTTSNGTGLGHNFRTAQQQHVDWSRNEYVARLSNNGLGQVGSGGHSTAKKMEDDHWMHEDFGRSNSESAACNSGGGGFSCGGGGCDSDRGGFSSGGGGCESTTTTTGGGGFSSGGGCCNSDDTGGDPEND